MTNLNFDNIDAAAEYFWGLPSHGGFASREKAKEAALLSAKNGNITLKDYTGTGITAPTSTPNFIDMNSNTIKDIKPNTQYKVQAKVGGAFGPTEDFTLVYKENGDYILIGKYGTEYSSKDVYSDIMFYDEQTRQYYDKAEDYQTLHDASTDGNKQARINGVGSHDRPDIHDEFMHHTHVTEKDLTIVESLAYTEDFSRNAAILKIMTTQQWTKQDAEKYISDLESSGKATFSYIPSNKDKYFVGKYVTWHTELA